MLLTTLYDASARSELALALLVAFLLDVLLGDPAWLYRVVPHPVAAFGKLVERAGARLHYLDPEELPVYDGVAVPANVYVLGAVLGLTGLGEVLQAAEVAELVQRRWKRGAERNRVAFEAGLAAAARLPHAVARPTGDRAA